MNLLKIKENRVLARKKTNRIEYDILTLRLGEVQTIMSRDSKIATEDLI